MKVDAATRTVEKAEARERAKARKALEKWLPMRRAQLALVGGGDVDITHADALIACFAERIDEVEPEVAAS